MFSDLVARENSLRAVTGCRSRCRVVAALVLILGVSTTMAPLSASAESHQVVRASRVHPPTTQEVRLEVERVVGEIRAAKRLARRSGVKASPRSQIASITQCAEFLVGSRYCLGYGWTTASEADVQAEMVAAAGSEAGASRRGTVEPTGDLSLRGMIDRAAAMNMQQRAESVRNELLDAAAGIDKFVELEELRRSPSPRSIKQRGSDLRASASLGGHYYGEQGAILKDRLSEQEKAYWCGPATMQMMAWNYGDHPKREQSAWASRLGTTASGTAITDMVRVANSSKYHVFDWVLKQDAYYLTLDIGNLTYADWYELNVNHFYNYETPVILHPVLLKQYYPYLDDDGSGHFQLGRGWDFQSERTDAWLLLYYEPWNQQRFNPSEPFIARKQTRSARNSYLANKAHFQHNIGV